MTSRPARQYVAISAVALGGVTMVIGFYGLSALATDENVRLIPLLVILLGLIALLNGLAAILRARVDTARRHGRSLPSEPPTLATSAQAAASQSGASELAGGPAERA